MEIETTESFGNEKLTDLYKQLESLWCDIDELGEWFNDPKIRYIVQNVAATVREAQQELIEAIVLRLKLMPNPELKDLNTQN